MLEQIAAIAVEHDLFVLFDEVYKHLYYGAEPFFNIAAVPGMRERTLVINSFSKAYAMTGWRVGYCAGPKELIQNMIMFQENVCACVNTAAQYAANKTAEKSTSENFVAIPRSAATHIQKTAPGPPSAIAPATPAMLPVPTVAASAVQTA